MKIGFLGAGAMGGAILSGAINAGVLDPQAGICIRYV